MASLSVSGIAKSTVVGFCKVRFYSDKRLTKLFLANSKQIYIQQSDVFQLVFDSFDFKNFYQQIYTLQKNLTRQNPQNFNDLITTRKLQARINLYCTTNKHSKFDFGHRRYNQIKHEEPFSPIDAELDPKSASQPFLRVGFCGN